MQLQAQDDHRATDIPRADPVGGSQEWEVQSERLALCVALRVTLLLAEDKEETFEGQTYTLTLIVNSLDITF